MSPEMSMVLLLFVVIQEGAAIRPAVTFSPNYKKIFTAQSITMTCDGGSTIGGGPNYIWSKDYSPVHNGKSYTMQRARISDSGSYRCKTSTGEISDPARLDVSNVWVILQTPLYVYEGDEINIRCHHRPGYPGRWTRFYKDKRVIRGWTDNAEYHIGKVDGTTAGTYRCEKEVYHNLRYYQHDDAISVSVEELFTIPIIEVTPHLVFTKDNLTVNCETRLPPARQNTQLRFAFFREGRIVQNFSINDIYEVYNVQLEHSGKYSCQVETTNGRVRKKSEERLLQIDEFFSHPNITGTSDSIVEGNPMTLTCDTTISPHINPTEVQFAFYRDGREVRGFTSSNTYEVQSANLEDSGNYTCEVRNSINTTIRGSCGLYINIQGTNGSNNYSVTLILPVSLGLLLFIMNIFILLYICYQRRPSTCNPQPPTNKKTASENELSLEGEVNYAVFDVTSRPQTSDNEYFPEGEVNYAVLDVTSRPQSMMPRDNGSNVVYAEVKDAQEMSDTSNNIYQNIGSHR